MRIIGPEAFVTMPWKNGGGITHEIAKETRAGRLLWRLSVAEVASDGPFSAFPGLTRILTVLSGAGLVLRTAEGVIEAMPLHPVRFSGDLPVTGERVAGDVRDLNLIFDAERIAGSVTPVTGPFEAKGPVALCAIAGLCLAGGQVVAPGSLALDAPEVELGQGAKGLLVGLRSR
jgi:environmental stress-induced protein Ves